MNHQQLFGCDERFAKTILSQRHVKNNIVKDFKPKGKKFDIYFLNIYDFYFLVAHAQYEFCELLDISLHDFKHFTHLKDSLYFVCSFRNDKRIWSLDYIIYNSPYNKTFLIKKLVLNTFKRVFTDITFDEGLSKATTLTIFNPNI